MFAPVPTMEGSLRVNRRRLKNAAFTAISLGSNQTHISRYVMYRQVREVTEALPKLHTTGRVLSISHSQALVDALELHGEVVDAIYPDENLLGLSFPDESFDVVVSDQVLEHIDGNPQRAVDESFRVVGPGGLVVHTTCFMNPIHLAAGDFWRFTPQALERLCEPSGEIVASGGWGNRWALLLAPRIRTVPVPTQRWHPLRRLAERNDPYWPIVTWVVARRRP